MELDDILKELGDFGRYQTIVYLMLSLIGQVPASWHMLAISFLGAVPDHHCKMYSVGIILATILTVCIRTTNIFSVSLALYGRFRRKHGPEIPDGGTKEGYIPGTNDPDTGDVEYDSCTIYLREGELNTTTDCDEWDYNEDPYGDTIVNEWDLVCDDAKFVEISQIVFMAGVMVGSVLFGQLSDRFGRKPILFVSLAVQVVLGTTVAFSTGIVFFTVVRFFMGTLEQGYDITSYVMVTELFTPRRRAYAGILLTNFWALGIMSLPLLAWLIQDWRYLQLAITLPLILALPLWWFIPESPRWLLSVGKVDKANEVISKMAAFNGKAADSLKLTPYDVVKGNPDNGVYFNDITSFDNETIEEATDDQLPKSPDNMAGVSITTSQLTEKATILDLFKSALLAKITVVMSFIWMVNAVIYYGLSLNTGSLAGDPYLNFFLSGAVEIPSYIMAVFVVTWFGRKLPVCVLHVIGGVACAVTVFIPEVSEGGKDLTPLIVTTAMTGKFCIAATYAIIFLYASEIFPTVVRNVGIGVLSFSSRIGGIIAPLMILLEDEYPKVPMILFGILSVLAGLAILLLPETKGRRQPQTIKELESVRDR